MNTRMPGILITWLALSATATCPAAEDKPAADFKQLKGIAIVGDKEAPKSLYIVPWHKAEHRQNTSLSARLIDNDMRALDRRTLQQQLQLYELSRSGWHRIEAGEP